MKIIILLYIILFSGFTWGQINSDFSKDPLEAKFVTADMDRFWEAFDKMATATENPFEAYIENGSLGVKGFTPYRILSADSLFAMVKQRKDDYLASKNVLQNLEEKKKRIQASYAAMKYWYPEAVFPPIYFVYGRFNSGGTVSEDGIIIGVEMLNDLEGLPGLVAHELIHFQQKIEIPDEEYTLLGGALMEGSADFIGELISGNNNDSQHFLFGEKHQDKLALEFAVSKDKQEGTDWLYGTSGKDTRPNDLGYWMGYKITKTYFDQAADKKLALKNILNFSDPNQFLKEGSFLKPYIDKVAKMTEAEKEKLLTPLPAKK